MVKKPWTAEAIAFVQERYEAGDTDNSIGAALQRSAASVANLRQAKNITRPQATLKRAPDWAADEIVIAVEMYAGGETNTAIAKAIGRSRIAIKRLVTERGLKRDAGISIDPARYDTEAERWLRAPDGLLYAVSSLGRVISMQPGKVGLLIHPWTDGDGYLHVHLQVDGASKRHALHRLVARTFHGEPPTPAHHAAHNDGTSSNNREGNIRWATPAENQADRILHGTADRAADGRFLKADMVRKARAAGLPVVEARI